MVAPIVFQPTLLDCWACRDFKRFRLVLRGGGAIVVHPSARGDNAQHGAVSGKQAAEGALSSSQSRSPGYSWGSAGNAINNGPCAPSEVNRRDQFGRTVLHLVAASLEPASIDYLTVLLAHPSVNVNLQDQENGWTALHRALYNGNLITALTLLKRTPAADTRIKDFEGLTPFDLYNSTVHGTNPPQHFDQEGGELFTWGANRNGTLGLGTSDDRALPDRRTLRRDDVEGRNGSIEANGAPGNERSARREAGSRYDRVSIRDVGMSKFATVVLTTERSNNVWVCGIGTNGRIGRAPQTQAFLEPLRDFADTAKQISVGPDHSCIVTTEGDIYTFGFNRFQQLGYPVEHGFGIVSSSTKGGAGVASTTFGGASIPSADLDIQISPRKILGALKKETILGAAAGKLHTAAFTEDSLFTWGTNTGQLGYDRAATPVQISPRKVTAITTGMSITAVAVSDFATACLTTNGDVLLLHNDSSFFVRFPQLSVGSQIYRPRQARPKPAIQTLVGGPNNSFACISDIGEVWQFSAGHPSEYSQPSGTSTAAKASVKPQLIWSVRKNKKVGAARDVAMGMGSDMILTTESGHVFVRQKKEGLGASQAQSQVSTGISAANVPSTMATASVKGKSGWKPIPFLQRVVKVATNESGGLAAIKIDAPVRKIRVRGRDLDEDLQDALPHLRTQRDTDDEGGKEGGRVVGDLADAGANDAEGDILPSDDEDSGTDQTGVKYISTAQTIAEAARRWTSGEDNTKLPTLTRPPLGCDMYVYAGGRYLPAHRSIVSARLPLLARFLEEPPSKGSTAGVPSSVSFRRQGDFVVMTLPSSSFGTALFLLHYLYTDDVPSVWAASIGMRVEKSFARVKMSAATIQSQLRSLAESLQMDKLLASLSSTVPRQPRPTLPASLEAFFTSHVETSAEQSPFHDVLIRFGDRDVPAHSVVLRRSPFFAAFFQPRWTSTRWDDGVIEIDMMHIRWEVARLVLLHLYTDKLAEVFDGCDVDRTADQYIDFVVEVLSFSNELLLDKFKLVCCALLRKRIKPTNVAAMIADADFYNVLPFKDTVMNYAACTLESLLEAGMLDDLETRMVKDLMKHVRARQDERMKRTHAETYLSTLIMKHQDYFSDLDIPPPSLGIAAARVPKRQHRASEAIVSPRLRAQDVSTPASKRHTTQNVPLESALTSPELRPTGSSTPSGKAPLVSRGDESLMFSMDDLNDAGRSPLTSALPAKDGDVANDLSLPPAATAASPGAAPWKSRKAEASKVASGSREASAAASPATGPLDLRSIMAAEQTRVRPSGLANVSTAAPTTQARAAATSTAAPPPASAVSGARLSQKDRKKQQLVSSATPSASLVTPTKPSTAGETLAHSPMPSPWKPVEPVRTDVNAPATPMRPSLLSSQTAPSTASPGQRQQGAGTASTGPFITPQKARPGAPQRLSAGGAGRESGSGPAWNASQAAFGSSPSMSGNGGWSKQPMSPPLDPPLSSTPSRAPFAPVQGSANSASDVQSLAAQAPAAKVGLLAGSASASESLPRKSFAQIQEEEMRRHEEVAALQQARAPRSFAELQEEDRLENERRRAEEQRARDFEREFEEESKRVQAERRKQARAQGGEKKGGGRRSGGGSGKGDKRAETGLSVPKKGNAGGRGGRGREKSAATPEPTANGQNEAEGKATKQGEDGATRSGASGRGTRVRSGAGSGHRGGRQQPPEHNAQSTDDQTQRPAPIPEVKQ